MSAPQMIDLEKNTNAAAIAVAGEDGEGGLTLAQNTFRTAVENTQTAWATLIKDTIETGKLDFGTFFTTVKVWLCDNGFRNSRTKHN